jgi:mannose-6-phosphate isomerase-like protein (cupin superfamily)
LSSIADLWRRPLQRGADDPRAPAERATMSDPDQSESAPREPQGGDDRRLDFRPGMGMWWEITRNTVDTSGELFEATNWIEPRMPGPPVHVHPTAEESYEVIEGALEVFMDGKWSPVRAGEKATVPAGVPHSVRNATEQPAKIINIHQPAQRFESFFRDMHRLIHEGKIKHLPPKEPRSAIYAAMLFGKYPDEIRATKPPNQIFQALALVGKALRFKV